MHHTTQKDSVEEIFDYINGVMEDTSYGIGLHSTQGEKIEGILDSIMKNGLEIEERKKILSTVSSFGTHTKITQDHLKQQIMQIDNCEFFFFHYLFSIEHSPFLYADTYIMS